MIQRARDEFGADHKLTKLFENCISNTLNTTIRRRKDGSVFVITGDIPAMWLRDSSCQLRPFLLFAGEEPEIRDMIVNLTHQQMKCILTDPYANAFNESANGNGFQNDRTQMKPELWERKYEIDSLCFPFQLSWLLWKNAGCTEQFDENWLCAARAMTEVFRTEQNHETDSSYCFERYNCVHTDTLSRNGKGALVKSGIGLTWSGFRPSDDACTYGYLIPSNMLAAVVLEEIAEVAAEILHEETFAGETMALAREIREAVEKYAIVPYRETEFYAYEVDGFGQYNIMDDANLPSLLSMPYFGYCDKRNTRYLNTRAIILSEGNPYYYTGKYLQGIGSPHTPIRYVWPISLCIQGLTSDSAEEKKKIFDMLCDSDADTCLMHESIMADDPSKFTRPWFSWANSVFSEFVMDYLGFSVKIC
ncbi:MAG: glycoside hydrolase family 125 protein [Clostridiales bacterium]|nr:glycoside hydrolase family 125 protein [Clostridiales bacterium]